MECKNCEKSLSQEDKFCNDCGAKVIDNRLSMKYLASETTAAFFNIDSSKPIRTFLHLFTQPQTVIAGYIEGVRKKYINAFGYFTIALTFSSFFYFVVFQWFPDAMNFTYSLYEMSEEQMKATSEANRTFFEYQSVFFFVMIPVLAGLSRLVFLKNKKYNYAEHLIINLYAYSHVSIVVTLFYLLTVWNTSVFQIVALLAMPFQFIYFAYTLKKLYKLSIGQTIGKTMLFLSFLIPLFILVVIAIGIAMYFAGFYDSVIEAEKAKRAVGYIASSVMNWTS